MIFCLVVALAGALPGVARAQQAPHDFRIDTPPVPGQVVEAPREKLRVTPSRHADPTDTIPLPTNGPKGLQATSSCVEAGRLSPSRVQRD